MIDPSPLLVYGFVLLAIALTAAIAFLTRSLAAAVLLGAWLAVTAFLAARGVVRFDTTPPTAMILLAISLGLALFLALSKIGGTIVERVPLAALVAVQSFRLPLELLMHRAYEEGLMPVQMSYSGRNFDIITGITAILVAFVASRWRIVAGWNVVGFLLLLNIMTVAMLSAPLPIRVFHNEPANVWVLRAPFIWLPVFFVPVALAGHLMVWRSLRRRR